MSLKTKFANERFMFGWHIVIADLKDMF